MVDFADFGLLRAKHEEMERRMALMEVAHAEMRERMARMEAALSPPIEDRPFLLYSPDEGESK